MGFIHAPPLKSSMAGCSISEYSEQSLITILYAKLLFKVLQNGYTCRGQDREGIEEYLSVMVVVLTVPARISWEAWACLMASSWRGFQGEKSDYIFFNLHSIIGCSFSCGLYLMPSNIKSRSAFFFS